MKLNLRALLTIAVVSAFPLFAHAQLGTPNPAPAPTPQPNPPTGTITEAPAQSPQAKTSDQDTVKAAQKRKRAAMDSLMTKYSREYYQSKPAPSPGQTTPPTGLPNDPVPIH